MIRAIEAAMLAFCAGDALGVPWEGRAPSAIDPDALEYLPAREDWPRGSTSDDTAQMLIVAEVLAEGGDAPERRFLDRLAVELPGIRGVGPTTMRAVERYRASGAAEAEPGVGDTNGAAMRALPIGWALPRAAVRREFTTLLSRTTHGADGAVAAACAVATMGSRALDGLPLEAVIDAGLAEAPAAADLALPPEGVPLDALLTLRAVVEALRAGGGDPAENMRAAVRLGGDTDTVAALAGGIAAAREPDAPIPWLERVLLPDAERVSGLAAALAGQRAALSS